MLKLLERISPSECPKLLHRVVDGLCGRSLPKRLQYGETWSLLEWGDLISSINHFFRVVVGRKCSDQEVQEMLGDLESVRADAILQCVNARQEEIRQALVDRTNRICSTQLDDFNWQLKLALSSDKLSSLNTPLLNLCLDLTENGIQRGVTIEMNKEELNTLITTLEAANKVILQMK
ncbi:COMM domain-containing protein 8 isoform X1 [Tachysurus vachellii]|uniref:COMM domain-containing protein 8 isoform X1 n=1 Tax=Tachysurus vachellii TaxID=175792 RepID=UPI00296ABAC2|nr:COMM domain-containing protein 8 isoform X1 [Tachysurus vachellii]